MKVKIKEIIRNVGINIEPNDVDFAYDEIMKVISLQSESKSAEEFLKSQGYKEIIDTPNGKVEPSFQWVTVIELLNKFNQSHPKPIECKCKQENINGTLTQLICNYCLDNSHPKPIQELIDKYEKTKPRLSEKKYSGINGRLLMNCYSGDLEEHYDNLIQDLKSIKSEVTDEEILAESKRLFPIHSTEKYHESENHRNKRYGFIECGKFIRKQLNK